MFLCTWQKKTICSLGKQERDGAALPRKPNIIWCNLPRESKHGISSVHTEKKSEPLKFPVAEVSDLQREENDAAII